MASRITERCLRMVPKAALSGVATGRNGNPLVNDEHHSGLWNSLHLFSTLLFTLHNENTTVSQLGVGKENGTQSIISNISLEYLLHLLC